jgi:prevent-host-death family protein
METIVGLKELREHIDKYASRAQKGETLMVVRRSKPLFRITGAEEAEWEEVIDFTKIKKGGVKMQDILSRL